MEKSDGERNSEAPAVCSLAYCNALVETIGLGVSIRGAVSKRTKEQMELIGTRTLDHEAGFNISFKMVK